MKAHHKFTLIEVVLALGILSILVVMSFSMLQSTRRLWEGMHTNSARLEAMQNIDRIADYTIKNMVPFQWLDDKQQERLVFRGQSDSLLFAHLHRSVGEDSGGIRFIELRLEDRKLIARYKQTPILYWLGEPVDDSKTMREVIASDVESISFEYAEREGKEIVWYSEWNDDEKKQIPLAVLMIIEFKDGSEEQWLRRTAGNSWNTSYGRRQY